MPRTCCVLPSSDASSSRFSVSSRGLPPPNCGGVNAVPVTFSYFHSLDFEIEYSVGLKRTSNGALAVDLELRLRVLGGRGHQTDLDAVVDDLDAPRWRRRSGRR